MTVRRVLFLAAAMKPASTMSATTLESLPGAPIDLRADYPQENSWGFQAFALTADPWSSRVFAGRAQGNLSELIAYQYDDFVPGTGQTYADGATAESMTSLPDAIDLDVELADRYVPC